MFQGTGIDPQSVKFSMAPFYAWMTTTSSHAAPIKYFSLPMGYCFRFKGGVLSAQGPARLDWTRGLEERALLVPGVTKLDTSQLDRFGSFRARLDGFHVSTGRCRSRIRRRGQVRNRRRSDQAAHCKSRVSRPAAHHRSHRTHGYIRHRIRESTPKPTTRRIRNAKARGARCRATLSEPPRRGHFRARQAPAQSILTASIAASRCGYLRPASNPHP